MNLFMAIIVLLGFMAYTTFLDFNFWIADKNDAVNVLFIACIYLLIDRRSKL